MEIWRIVVAFILPPAAVLDKGCGAVLIVGILTLFGWFPGMVTALMWNLLDQQAQNQPVYDLNRNQVFIPHPVAAEKIKRTSVEKAKRDAAYIRLADGAVAEVIKDDAEDEPPARLLRR